MDGFSITRENIQEFLIGSDVPGSKVNITLSRSNGQVSSCRRSEFFLLSSKYIESISLDGVWQDRVIDVELTRMASEDIADRRRAFELFASLKVRLDVTIQSVA